MTQDATRPNRSRARSRPPPAGRIRTEEMILNMGPQHPSTHGVLRLELVVDGEIVVDVIPHIGYLHRCFEKHCEAMTNYQQVIPYCDRLDYVAAMNKRLRLSPRGREDCSSIKVPERVEYIRVIMAEFQRIASPPDRPRDVRPRHRRVHPVPLHVPRPREDPRPLRDDLRRAPALQLHLDRRRSRTTCPPEFVAEGEGVLQVLPARTSRSSTTCSPSTRSSSSGRRTSACSRRTWRSTTPAQRADAPRLRREVGPAQERPLLDLRQVRIRHPGRDGREWDGRRLLGPLHGPDARDGAEPQDHRAGPRPASPRATCRSAIPKRIRPAAGEVYVAVRDAPRGARLLHRQRRHGEPLPGEGQVALRS